MKNKQRLIDILVKWSRPNAKINTKKQKITYRVMDEQYHLVAPVGLANTEDEAKAKCENLMKRKKGYYATVNYSGSRDHLELYAGKEWKYESDVVTLDAEDVYHASGALIRFGRKEENI